MVCHMHSEAVMNETKTPSLPPYFITGQWVDPKAIAGRGRHHPYRPETVIIATHNDVEMIFRDQEAYASWLAANVGAATNP